MGDITAVEKVFSLVEKSALSEEAKQGFARRRLQLMEEYSPSLTKWVPWDFLYSWCCMCSVLVRTI